MTTMDDLKNMHDLELQFGQSIIQSPAGWTLDPISRDEHFRITFSLQSDEAPEIEMQGQ